jgi:hypothetical protein
MTDKPSDLVQGTLDMLILKTLALEPMHGYGPDHCLAIRVKGDADAISATFHSCPVLW